MVCVGVCGVGGSAHRPPSSAARAAAALVMCEVRSRRYRESAGVGRSRQGAFGMRPSTPRDDQQVLIIKYDDFVCLWVVVCVGTSVRQ